MVLRTLVLTPSVQSPGGIQRYARKLTSTLQDLLGCSNVHAIALPEPERRGPTKLGIPLSARWEFARRAIWENVRWHPDLTICTHVGLGPIGWLARTLTRRPYWIVVHGIEAWRHLPLLKRIALSHADRVIVTSGFSREQVARLHGIGPERILVLPCMLDQDLLTIEPARSGLLRSVSDGQRVALTVARMAASEGYKGHDVVLRALPSVLARVPNLTYIIVGDGDDRPRLEGLAKELRVTEHVIFTGEVSEPELAALYHRCEVFVLPARTVVGDRNPKGEGFGIVFLEAMAFGKPVVGPDYGAPTELIRHGENGLLVNPEDATSVAEALVDLMTNPELARQMGKTGQDWVREHHSSGSFRERLQETLAG